MQEAIERLLKSGCYEQAALDCQGLLQLYPAHARLHGLLGIALLRQNKLEAAQLSFFRAHTLDANFIEAAVKDAQILFKLHRFREAMDLVKEWRPRFPNCRELEGLEFHLNQEYDAVEHDAWEISRNADIVIVQARPH